jgi:hypothetical protein
LEKSPPPWRGGDKILAGDIWGGKVCKEEEKKGKI